jgi:hypothetical protein
VLCVEHHRQPDPAVLLPGRPGPQSIHRRATRLGDLAIRTTTGMGSLEKRLGKVTTMLSVVLSVLLLVNLAGVLLVLANRY